MIGWIPPPDLSDDDREVCRERGWECDQHFVCAGCREVTHVSVVVRDPIYGVVFAEAFGDPPMCIKCRGVLRRPGRRRRGSRRSGHRDVF